MLLLLLLLLFPSVNVAKQRLGVPPTATATASSTSSSGLSLLLPFPLPGVVHAPRLHFPPNAPNHHTRSVGTASPPSWLALTLLSLILKLEPSYESINFSTPLTHTRLTVCTYRASFNVEPSVAAKSSISEDLHGIVHYMRQRSAVNLVCKPSLVDTSICPQLQIHRVRKTTNRVRRPRIPHRTSLLHIPKAMMLHKRAIL